MLTAVVAAEPIRPAIEVHKRDDFRIALAAFPNAGLEPSPGLRPFRLFEERRLPQAPEATLWLALPFGHNDCLLRFAAQKTL